MARGVPSNETLACLASLNRPLNVNPMSKVVLFATNNLTKNYNEKILSEFLGEETTYTGTDDGEAKHLSKFTAEKVIIPFRGLYGLPYSLFYCLH